MLPNDATLTETANLYSDHLIRRGDLTLSSADGVSSLSPVLSASSAMLTDVDYRNRDNTSIAHGEWGGFHGLARPGILYNQWLATVLQSTGVPPSEYERDGLRGYGSQYMDNEQNPNSATVTWPDRLRNDANNIVPFLATEGR